MKKRIKMVKSKTGSEDGFTVKRFSKEKTYHVSPGLAQVFVEEMGAAEYVDPIARQRILETPEDSKAVEGSLSNPPKTWEGFTIRQKETGLVVKILDILRSGRAQLSNGEIISYQRIRREWEVVNATASLTHIPDTEN